jgi:hypothetical protein
MGDGRHNPNELARQTGAIIAWLAGVILLLLWMMTLTTIGAIAVAQWLFTTPTFADLRVLCDFAFVVAVTLFILWPGPK